MNNAIDLKSQLSAVRNQVRPSHKAPIIKAELVEGDWGVDSWIRFTAPADERLHFSSVSHLFSVLRDAIRLASGDNTWSIRYASQVPNDNIPFLHCGSKKVIMFDPMLIFRNPLREFYATRQFLWCILASQAYYFKSFNEVQEVNDRHSTISALQAASAEAADSIQPDGDVNV